MIYDGQQQTLVLFQTTINGKHVLPYNDLVSFINNDPIQLVYNDDKETKERKMKYRQFFNQLTENLVSYFIFQWLTNGIATSNSIKNRSKESKDKNGLPLSRIKVSNGRIFEIIYDCPQLFAACSLENN